MQVAGFGRPLPPLRRVGDKTQFLCPRCLEEVKTGRLHSPAAWDSLKQTWQEKGCLTVSPAFFYQT